MYNIIIKLFLVVPYIADKFLAYCYKKCMKHCGKGVYLRPLSSDFKGLENLSMIVQVSLKNQHFIVRKLLCQ